jgi:hypothetical protein
MKLHGIRQKNMVAYHVCHWWWSRGILLLLAIVSVPQKKKPFHSNSYCGSYMCKKKREDYNGSEKCDCKKQNKKTKL